MKIFTQCPSRDLVIEQTMAPTATFLVLLALMSNPFCFYLNGIIWAPNVLLLTLLRPILVIAAFPHISFAGNTHNNHIISSLRRTSRNHVCFKATASFTPHHAAKHSSLQGPSSLQEGWYLYYSQSLHCRFNSKPCFIPRRQRHDVDQEAK